jgi:uncharacterized protein YjdB
MTYKYTQASIAASARKGNSPKDQYIDLFQETLKEQFYNSSNWWTVQEEKIVGSAEYENIDVRIAHVINAETGLKLGDDWKTVLFKEINHVVELGRLYIFDNSTWLTINSEIVKNLTATSTIRRCNNSLRWIDEPTGAYYEEPCAIEYMVKEPRDYVTQGSPFMTPGGFLHIEMQLNNRSGLIKQNQRFLFGNPGHWTCYKVIGTGINDFRNVNTYDENSAKILSLDLIANFVNDELDDIVNGIADVNTNAYTITVNQSNAEGAPGDTVQLSASVTYNKDSVVRAIEWSSSNNHIATVSGSGLVTFVALGTCTITANILENTTSDSCVILVTNTPTTNTEVRIIPDTNFILEGSSRTYSVYLYENDVQQADAFTITCSGSNVPASNYTFTQVSGNSFSVKNILRDVSSYLTIQAVSGTNTKDFIVYLRGAWQYDNTKT